MTVTRRDLWIADRHVPPSPVSNSLTCRRVPVAVRRSRGCTTAAARQGVGPCASGDAPQHPAGFDHSGDLCRAINGKGEPQVSQSIPASQIAVGHAEEAHDLFDEFAQDGYLCPDEIARMRDVLDGVAFHAQRADLARAFGVSLLRGGFASKRSRELANQWEAMEGGIETDWPLDAA